jgi:hypothetical protein
MVGLVPQGGTSGPTAGGWSKAVPLISTSVKPEGDGFWSATIGVVVFSELQKPFPGAPVELRRQDGSLVKNESTNDDGRVVFVVSELRPGKHGFYIQLPAGHPKKIEIAIKVAGKIKMGEPNQETGKDTWEVPVSMQVTESDLPLEGHKVLFQLDGGTEVVKKTNSFGTASLKLAGIPKGNHLLTVTPEYGRTEEEKFELKSSAPPKKAAKLLIQYAESGKAERRIRMSVLTEDNSAVKNAVVTVTDLDEPEKLFEAKSDENGKAEIVIDLRKGRNRISFMVLNSSIMEERFLYV